VGGKAGRELVKVLKRGHRYALDQLGSADKQIVQFPNKEPGQEAPGSTTQEFVRMLIDRTHYCNNCLPHRVNEQIIWHFRMIIALHEGRALEQKVAKGELKPELQSIGPDGHLMLSGNRQPQLLEERELKPVEPLGTFHCVHRSGE
jgi:hypothetical protein